MRKRKLIWVGIVSLVVILGVIVTGCAGSEGPQGLQGPQGPAGTGLTEEQAGALEVAGSLGFISPAIEEPSRGCPACHVLVDPETGGYTLAFEAHERVEARGEGRHHPEVAPDGTSLEHDQEVNVTTCLQCHAAGTGAREGKGVIAPLMLRDIVHPAHMGSQYFKLHYGGSCFTCHNVNGEGEWELLTEAVDVNEKGVPNPNKLPIPGAVEIN